MLAARVVVCVVLWYVPHAVGAQEPEKKAEPPGQDRVVRIPRVNVAPKIDDYLSGNTNHQAAVLSDFVQFDPQDGTPVSQKTTAYLSYDDKNLYVVFVCEDDQKLVRAHLSKREDVGQDDQVAVYLDTFDDKRRAFIFGTNPLGVQFDAIRTEGKGFDFSFDTLWYSEGKLTPNGYVVWIAIPFKSLRFPAREMQKWGIALNRVILRQNEIAYWPYITKRVDGLVQQLATAEGLEDISPGRNLQFIPYGIGTRSRLLDPVAPGGPAYRNNWTGRVGLDAKIVVKDAVTIDVAANPDFSEVESDEPQVLVNRRFEVFFPEKRPFFIENAGYFQTPINLFFSRRIADPQFGTRVTGKIGPWSLGVLASDDRPPDTDPLSGNRAGIGVVRVARDVGRESGIGLLVASQDLSPTNNRVFALDGRWKLSDTWVLEAQGAYSTTKQATGRQQCQSADANPDGYGLYMNLGKFGRNLTYTATYTDFSPGFCTEMGFVPRVDIREMQHFVGYFWRPEKGKVVGFGPVALALVNWNHAGQVQDWQANFGWQMVITGQTRLNLTRGESFELFQGKGFRKHVTAVDFSTEWLTWLTWNVSYSLGISPNFFPATGQDPFLAHSQFVQTGFGLRPSPRLRWDQTYINFRLKARESTTPAGFSPTDVIFTNHILRTKVNYQFTRALSLRVILDYNSILPNPGLVSLTRSKRLTGDILLTYLVNPGTAFYVGYTDQHANLALPTLTPAGGPTTLIGRQFFAKISYLFRY